MLSFMEHHDAIVCPACARPALPHGHSMARDMIPAFSYTMTYNLTGWPAAVLRAGTSPEGLPIGIQVVARPWREDVVAFDPRFEDHHAKNQGGHCVPGVRLLSLRSRHAACSFLLRKLI